MLHPQYIVGAENPEGKGYREAAMDFWERLDQNREIIKRGAKLARKYTKNGILYAPDSVKK